MKRPSLPLSDERLARLASLSSVLGCKSWRSMLRMIADGELVVSRPWSKSQFHEKLREFEDSQPKQIAPQPPSWDAPVAENQIVYDSE